MNPRIRAFTLVELLAVILIIGVLAGLVVVTVGPLRRKAKESASMSNLRSIGVALATYRADNKNRFPPVANATDTVPQTFNGGYWSTVSLAPYVPPPESKWLTIRGPGYAYAVSSIFIDPMLDEGRHHDLGDYGANLNIIPLGRSVSFGTLTNPSELVTVAAAEFTDNEAPAGCWYIDGATFMNGGNPTKRPAQRGTNNLFLLFADGHAAVIPVATVDASRRSYFHPNP